MGSEVLAKEAEPELGSGRARKERERVVGCSEGQGSGLVAQASMRWGRDKGEGSSSEGPRPASLKGDAPLTTVISWKPGHHPLQACFPAEKALAPW